MSPVWLSVTVGFAATAVSLPPGIAVAWLLERGRFPGRGLLHVLVLLPLALPPVVTGYLRLWLFSPRGDLGRALARAGLPVAFHWLGAAVAAAVVGFPLLVMSVSLALKAVDARLETMSRSLGRGRWATFCRVTLPLAWPGILAGAVLSFARGLGEFGATIVLAGRIPGETETLPLAVYALLDQPGRDVEVRRLVLLSVGLALIGVILARVLDRRHRRRLELAR
ncbi:MAG: molybdate ABC transporter permease subunit [Planctomycetota bacterium]